MTRSINNNQGPWRVILADDHPGVREGVKAMLKTEPTIEVIGEARDGNEAFELVKELTPDLLIMDLRMPNSDGLDAADRIKGVMPETPIVFYTSHADPEYLLRAVQAGVADYILKDTEAHDFIDSIGNVLNGEAGITADTINSIFKKLTSERDRWKQTNGGDDPPGWMERHIHNAQAFRDAVTPREVMVLQRIAYGWTNQQIGENLHLSKYTVKNYIESVCRKWDVSDRTQAAVRALTIGLIKDADTSGAEALTHAGFDVKQTA